MSPKIRLIAPHNDTYHWSVGRMAQPAALTYLAAVTPPDFEVEIVDMEREALRVEDPVDLVGVTAMTTMSTSGFQVADAYRARGVPVVLGGHHATANPAEAKTHADVVVVGEAEKSWPIVLEDWKRGELRDFYVTGYPNLAGKLPGNVHHDPEPVDLARIPVPRRDLLRHRYFFDTIGTSRGCPFDCAFCAVTEFYGRTLRHRPIPHVMEELKHLRRYWFMTDDNIFDDVGYRLELYDAMSKIEGFKLWFGAGSLSIGMQKGGEEVLTRAARSGLTGVFIGLESINPATIAEANISRKIRYSQPGDLETNREVIRMMERKGLTVFAFFMFGFESEGLDVFDETLDYCNRLGVAPVPILLVPYPGTEVGRKLAPRLIPGIGWDRWDGAHALYLHPKLTPWEREYALGRFRRRSYTIGRILKRIPLTNRRTLLFSLFTQLGMRQSFRKEWRSVLSHRAPEEWQVRARPNGAARAAVGQVAVAGPGPKGSSDARRAREESAT